MTAVLVGSLAVWAVGLWFAYRLGLQSGEVRGRAAAHLLHLQDLQRRVQAARDFVGHRRPTTTWVQPMAKGPS